MESGLPRADFGLIGVGASIAELRPTVMQMLIGRNEMRFVFSSFGQARIDYYECGSPTPTRVQFIERGR